MAMLKLFEPSDVQTGRVHEQVDCRYKVFENGTNGPILQLDTFGSGLRDFPGKVSQTIQLDRDSAQELCRIIEKIYCFK